MITAIDQTHPIFSSPAYLKDIVPFSLMEAIKKDPMLLVSNEKDFIIGMSAPQMPVWVWTDDAIHAGSLQELCEYFYSIPDKFNLDNKIRFVAKPDVANALAKPFLNGKNTVRESRVCMESFENKKVIPPKNTSVVIERPDDTDVESIAVCMSNFEKDCFGKEVSPASLLEKAKSKLLQSCLFVIRQNGGVVSIAQISRETDTHMSISLVYTLPEYRKRGYAAALVAHISALILEKGKIPALYTDLSNPASNKSYQNVGFTPCGQVDEVTLTWSQS